MDKDLNALAEKLGKLLLKDKRYLVTAESCTGGGIAHAVTSVAGSSQWFDRGFVCYSNDAKQAMLEVPLKVLEQHGAVSAATAEAMALGALKASKASVSVAVTGIAGPSGGSAEKPVGTVWFGFAYYEAAERVVVKTQTKLFAGDREAVQRASILFAFESLLKFLSS